MTDPLHQLPSLQASLATHGLLARKSLGQHFLLDGAITAQVAAQAGDLSQFSVIEIGPGPGGLTRSLLAAGAASVLAIEKDARFLPMLAELQTASGGRLQVMQADALRADLLALAPPPRKIVANLPYNVGTQLLVDWLQLVAAHGPETFASLTLMFQKEVALRIVSPPGDGNYGRLSVLAQFLCDCQPGLELPPEAFLPPPKVHSMVVTLTPRARPLFDVPLKALERVAAAAFGQRRKMLRSSLKSLGVEVGPLLERADVDGSLRAEQLDVAAFCRLAGALA